MVGTAAYNGALGYADVYTGGVSTGVPVYDVSYYGPEYGERPDAVAAADGGSVACS